MSQPHQVVVLALPGVMPFELAIPGRLFGSALSPADEPLYEVITCSLDGGPVAAGADYAIAVKHGPEVLTTADTVVIPPSHAMDEVVRTGCLPPSVEAALRTIRPGTRVAADVARNCVISPQREGGQRQFTQRPVPAPARGSTAAARAWALDCLGDPLTLTVLAERSAMSVRTFTRRFRAETGVSPGEWLAAQRLDYARTLLEGSDLTVDQVAARSGLGTGANLRQQFRAALGVSPAAYRRTFHQAA